MHGRRTHFSGRALIALFAIGFGMTPLHAQKIVDPSKVAPEFREAAEKRRAEQLKIAACTKASQDAKVKPRDFAKSLADCIDRPDDKVADKPK